MSLMEEAMECPLPYAAIVHFMCKWFGTLLLLDDGEEMDCFYKIWNKYVPPKGYACEES